MVTSRVFSSYGITLNVVLSFKYLGRVLSESDNEWSSVIWNLTKARAFWRRMTRILSREGAKPWFSRFFFKAIIQSVFLFSAEKWVVTPFMGRVLGGFQYQVAR